MEQNQISRTHRVGTLTFGGILIMFGLLFLIHIFVPALEYGTIFRLWPCIFIFLGIEVLIGNWKTARLEKEDEPVNFVYDKAAILLIISLTFFAMIMAAVDYSMQHAGVYIQI